MNVHDDRRLNEHHVLFFVPGVHTFHTTLLIRLSNFQFFLHREASAHTKTETRAASESPLAAFLHEKI